MGGQSFPIIPVYVVATPASIAQEKTAVPIAHHQKQLGQKT
jgi:hypothetical protein